MRCSLMIHWLHLLPSPPTDSGRNWSRWLWLTGQGASFSWNIHFCLSINSSLCLYKQGCNWHHNYTQSAVKLQPILDIYCISTTKYTMSVNTHSACKPISLLLGLSWSVVHIFFLLDFYFPVWYMDVKCWVIFI